MRKKLLWCSLAAFYVGNSLMAQTLDRSYPTTNGAVRVIVQKNDTAYLGGEFTQLGLQAKGIARFVPGNTVPDNIFPQIGANSKVTCVESDSNGGFYVAGSFQNFNGTPITNNTKILHILSNGTIDPNFGSVTTDGDILCMKKADTVLYVGGAWTNIQGTAMPYLASLNPTTGSLRSWVPATPDNPIEKIEALNNKIFVIGRNLGNLGGYDCPTHFGAIKTSGGGFVNDFPTTNNTVSAIAVSGNLLYLGGNFNQAGPGAYGVAQLSITDGTADPDFPTTNGSVLTFLPDGSGGFYIGGNFTKVANLNRKNLAHILSDGTIDPLINVSVNNTVLCLAADANNLYFGGNFTMIGNNTRNYVAAVSKSTGALTSWAPNPDSTVNTIVAVNNTIYLGGWFTTINSTARNYAAAVDNNNVLKSWAPEPNYYVNQIIPNSNGTSLFLCGGFTTIQTLAHEYIAKVNNSTGTPATWRPQPDGVVNSIALNGATIYLGGFFAYINGTARNFLGAVDTTSNTPNSFIADLNNYPNFLNIASNKLYVAGNYSQIQGVNFSYISRIDLSTNLVDGSWNPVSNAYTATVYCDGSNVVIGGNFTLVNGIQKNYVAAINVAQNKFTNWTGAGVASFNVNTISKILPVGSDIFIGGDFNYFDGYNTIYNILSLDSNSGNISHLFTQYPLGLVSQLSIFNNKLMVGGNFNGFYNLNNGFTANRKNLAAYSQTDYSLSSNLYDANDTLNGMFTDNSGNLITSGNFSLMNTVDRNHLAAINLTSKNILSFNPSPDSTVNALAISGSSLFVGGAFKNIKATSKKFIASLNRKNGNLNASWDAGCDSTVFALSVKGTTLYLGGLFTIVKGVSRLHAATVSTTGSASLKSSWNPSTDNVINAINTTQGIYIGGSFTKVKTLSRKNLARVKTNGDALGWAPNPNGEVSSFAGTTSTIYVGGNGFTKISGKTRNALAAYTISNNGFVSSFDAQLKYNNASPQVNALALSGNNLYIGATALDQINGASRGSLAAVNVTNNNATSFNPQPDGAVLSLSIGSGYLLAGGLWNSLGSNVSPSYFAVFNLNGQLQNQQPPVAKVEVENIQTSDVSKTVIFPNPARDMVTVDFNKTIANAKITLVNTAGNIIWLKNDFNGRQLKFEVKSLTAGNYFILVQSGSFQDKLKLIVE